MAGGTLFIKVLPEKGAEAAIQAAVERGGAQAEGKAKESGNRWGLGFATAAGVAIGRGLQQAAALEQIEVSLTTLTGSAEEAQALLADLTDFARETPFEMQGLAENARNLLGVGVAADEVIPILQILGDTSAALGLSQEQMDRVMRAVTQSMAKGKIQQEEMLQLAEAGIPIYDLMARAVGKTVPEMQEMAKNGELLSGDVMPALLAVMQEDFAGGMVAQSKTLNGVISTLRDDIDLGLAEAVKDLIPLLVDLLPSAGKAAGGVLTAFGVALKVLTTIATPFVQALDAILEGFGSLPGPIQTAIVAMVLLGRVTGAGGLVAGIIGMVKGLWAGRAAMLAAATASGTLGSRIAGVGTAAARAAGGGGIKALLSSLVGGPWGVALLAIGAVVAAIVSIANQAENAKERVDALVGDVDFSSRSGPADAIARLNEELKSSQEYLDTFALTDGGDWFSNLFTSADNTIDEVKDALAELEEGQERYRSNSERMADQLGISVAQLEALARAGDVDLNLLAGDAEDVALFREQLEGANAAVEGGFDPTTALGEAMTTLGDEAATAAEKSDALREALELLAGNKIGVLEATAAWQESLADFVDSLQTTNEEGETVINDLALAAVDAAGNIDLMSEAGRGVQDAVLGAADAMRDQAQAAYDAAIANGDVAGAADAAGAAAQAARDDFIQQAQDMGFTREQAEGLANTYGLLPASVVTAIGTPGMSEAQLNVALLENQLVTLPPNTPVRVTSLTEEAMRRLEILGFTVETLPDGSIQVTAPNAEAVGNLIDDQASRERTAVINVTYRTQGSPVVASVNAEGAALDFYAGGGLTVNGRRLRPMRANWAAEVPANTWRVIGDRARGREWYIPEDAPNSLPLLQDAAAAHGLALVRAMADGGLLGGQPTPVAAGRVTNIENNLFAAPSLPTIDQLARMQRRAEVLAGA